MSMSTPIVVSSYVGFMARSQDRAGLATLWGVMLGIRGNTREAKRVASEMGLDPLAASFHCRKLVEGVEYPTGAEMLASVEARLEASREAAIRRAAEPRPREIPWYDRHSGSGSPSA